MKTWGFPLLPPGLGIPFPASQAGTQKIDDLSLWSTSWCSLPKSGCLESCLRALEEKTGKFIIGLVARRILFFFPSQRIIICFPEPSNRCFIYLLYPVLQLHLVDRKDGMCFFSSYPEPVPLYAVFTYKIWTSILGELHKS